MAFCGHCGVRDEVERPPVVGTWGCRSCTTVNAEAMQFCGRCGSRRGEQRTDDLRWVTSLFADISGFTSLADQLDAEDLHAVINPLIAGLAGIAERYDGFVAKYAGDALLCLFGAPYAHEDDAQRALLAALEMHATLPSLLASLGPAAADLSIHIGVNTGKVVAGAVGSAAQNDYSVLGDSVILAQRLESVCPSGQTFVGESTRELCKDEFDFEDVGALQLKGKLSAVHGFRLVGRRRTGTDASRPLVGREAELTALLSTVDRAGAAIVVGEPGVGKSRLLAEARLRATASGVRWLPMRCLSYGASLPYWPFVDLLRQALGLRVEDPAEAVLSRLASSLPPSLVAGAARLLGTTVDDLEPEAARRQVHDALAGMLAVLSGGRPVVLAVEDVHWIDQPSADVLGELIRLPGTVPLGVVVTTRAEGLPTARGLASQATISAEIAVEPLGPESVPLVAAAVLGAPVAVSTCEFLVARTRGNPLFVEELARSLQEDGALVSTSAGLELRPGFDLESMPDTVERVFSARVDSLPLPEASVLLIAAVVGRVVRLSLLEAVAFSQDTDLAPLDDLVAAGLLDRVIDQDEPAVTFHHALLHDAVYGRLLKRQRKVIHRNVADAGRALYGDGDETIDLLARHLYLAEAGEEAVEALLRSGRRAARMYANDSAAVALEQAIEVLDDMGETTRSVPVRRELAAVQELRGAYGEALRLRQSTAQLTDDAADRVGAASVLRKLGDYEGALAQLALAGRSDRIEDVSVRVALHLEAARSHFLAGRPADALEAIRLALRALPAGGGGVHAELLMELAWIESETGHPEFAVTHVRRALPLLRNKGQERTLVTALRRLGGIQRLLGQQDEATASLREAIAIALRIGHIEEAAAAMLNLGLTLSAGADHLGAAEVTREATGIFERLGHGSGRANSYSNLADALLRCGQHDEALGWAEKALATAKEIELPRMVAFATITIAEIELERGMSERAREYAVRARGMFLAQAQTDMVSYCDVFLAGDAVPA